MARTPGPRAVDQTRKRVNCFSEATPYRAK